MLKPILLSLLLFPLISCQTIHYVNSESAHPSPPYYEHVKWHHIGLWGLWEFSPPVNTKTLCGEKNWKSVRTQTNVLQVLVTAIVPILLEQINAGFQWVDLYTPEEVSVACGAIASTVTPPSS